jgi:hypothetical protein
MPKKMMNPDMNQNKKPMMKDDRRKNIRSRLIVCGLRVTNKENEGGKMTVCKTCCGCGLWAFGDHVAMGTIDALEGYQTIPCPECGANRNPETIHIPPASQPEEGEGRGKEVRPINFVSKSEILAVADQMNRALMPLANCPLPDEDDNWLDTRPSPEATREARAALAAYYKLFPKEEK